YNLDQADFETEGIRVTEIDYTGHLVGSARDENGAFPDTSELVVPPFHQVKFEYDSSRPDVRHVRFRRSALPRKYRLTRISTALGDYSFRYHDPDVMLPSRLHEIDYCAPTTGPFAIPPCMEPLIFDWDSDLAGGGYQWDEVTSMQLPAR